MPIPETVEQIEAALAHKTVYEAAVLVHEWLHPLPPGGFVRVRIAVGVADDGEWIANGWKNSCDGDVIDEMSEPYRDHIVFIEADVQPPPAGADDQGEGRVILYVDQPHSRLYRVRDDLCNLVRRGVLPSLVLPLATEISDVATLLVIAAEPRVESVRRTGWRPRVVEGGV